MAVLSKLLKCCVSGCVRKQKQRRVRLDKVKPQVLMEDGTSVDPPSTSSRPVSPPTPPSEFTPPVSPPTPPSEFTPPVSPPTPPSEFTPPVSPPTPPSEFTPPVSPPTPPSEFTPPVSPPTPPSEFTPPVSPPTPPSEFTPPVSPPTPPSEFTPSTPPATINSSEGDSFSDEPASEGCSSCAGSPTVPLFTWVDFTDEESISDSDSFLSFTERDVSVISAESDTCLTLSFAESSYCTTAPDLSASSSFIGCEHDAIGEYAGNSPTPPLTENFIQPAEIDYLPAGAFGGRDLFADVFFIKRARDACTKELEGTSSSFAQNDLYESDPIVAGSNDDETAEILVENHAVYNDSTSMALASNDLSSDAKSAGVFVPTAFSVTYTYQRALQLLATYQIGTEVMVIGTITVKQSAASLTSHGSFFAPGLFFPSSRLTYAFQRPLRLMAAYQFGEGMMFITLVQNDSLSRSFVT